MRKTRRHHYLEYRYGLRTPPGITVTDDEVKDLRLAMQGEVITSFDNGYDAARQLSNHAFSPWPLLIAYCEVPSDVAACLRWAQKLDIWLVVRSGGHSTAGFSANTGLVIDMSRFRYAVVEDPTGPNPIAVVGAGTGFGHLNAVLNDYNLHIPGGGCPDVCVAGYMQGGGFGFTSRTFGMNCDNVESVRMMLWDGGIVIADANTNKDLLWAVCGGTGNNFGVVLEISYRTQRIGPTALYGFGLNWVADKSGNAAAALDLLQTKYMRGCDPRLGYMAFLAVDTPDPEKTGTPLLMFRAMFLGPEKEARTLLDPLIRSAGAISDNKVDGTGSYIYLNDHLLSYPREIPEVPDLGREDKASVYVDSPLGKAGWQSVIDRFLDSPNPWTTVCIEPYGGKIEAVADPNAFIHRRDDMDLFVDVFWMTDQEQVEAQRYLEDFMTALAPISNGHSYQNYPRRNTPDYRFRYWGNVFDKLLKIKKKYDPKDVFHYAQSISAPTEPDARLSGGGPDLSGWIARPIEKVSER